MSDITASIDMPDGDRLVLFSLSAPGHMRGSIARLRSSGDCRWIAHAPGGSVADGFVAIALKPDGVRADTFQGMRLRLDPETGAVLEQAFLK